MQFINDCAPAGEQWRARISTMAHLGYLLMEESPAKAMKWLERAADAGDRDAMVNCGVLSQRLAESWFKKAAAAGDTGALANLAYLLRGLRPDDSRQWAQRAADSTDPELDDTLDILFPDAEPKMS